MAGQPERQVLYLMATQSPGDLQKKNTLVSHVCILQLQTYLSVVGGATGGRTTRKTGLSYGNSEPGCSSIEENKAKHTRKSCLYPSGSDLMLVM